MRVRGGKLSSAYADPLLSAIVETAADAIIVIDEAGCMESVNPAFEKLFGYAADEIIGRNVKMLMPSPYHEEHDGYLETYLRTGEKRIIGIGREVLARRKDRTTFPIHLAVSDMRVEGRRLFAGIIRDISDQKEAERQLQLLNRTLAEKNKELETILYVTSHDLRSPLVNIQGFSKELSACCDRLKDILLAEDLSEASRRQLDPLLAEEIPEAVRFVLSSVIKMDALLAGVLKVFRLGRTALEVQALDMNAMLKQILETMEFQIKETGAAVQVDRLPSCLGDEAAINQVFSNLIDNGLKYRQPRRPPEIAVRGWQQGSQAVYCVEDKGVGIPADHQAKVFEIFHRLDHSKESGEGLGLTISQLIINKHNGRIWLESEPGGATRFFVSLKGLPS